NLRSAEDTICTANIEVAHGNPKPGAERAILFNGVDSFAGGADHHELARQQKVSVRFVLGTSDPPPQLIQISQAEAIGAINDDGVGVWNIQTALDDGGRS